MIKNEKENGINTENKIIDQLILEVNSLSKSYGQKKVLNDLNFTVKEGEIFALLGPNGAGKTTFLKCLLNISRKDGGEIRLFKEKSNKGELRKNISFLGEEYNLYSYLTSEEILKYAASFYDNADVEWGLNLLKRFDIPLSEKVKNFSKGMKQTVKLTQALLNKGELIILDEPTSGLDVERQHYILNLLKKFNKEGKTILFSSHNLFEVKKLADRIAFIKDGKILAVKEIEEIADEKNTIVFVPQNKISENRLLINGVTGIDKVNNKYFIYYDKNEEDILNQLSQIPYFTLKFDNPDLEEVFMKYMGGDDGANN